MAVGSFIILHRPRLNSASGICRGQCPASSWPFDQTERPEYRAQFLVLLVEISAHLGAAPEYDLHARASLLMEAHFASAS
jgi:hypothetical protein